MRLLNSAIQTKFHSYSPARFHYVFDGFGESPRLWKYLSPAAFHCAVHCTTTTLPHRLPGTKSLPEQDMRTLACVRIWLQRDFILTGPCPQQSWLASKTIRSVSILWKLKPCSENVPPALLLTRARCDGPRCRPRRLSQGHHTYESEHQLCSGPFDSYQW